MRLHSLPPSHTPERRSLLVITLTLWVGLAPGAVAADGDPGRHDVVWDSPSADASGSMPLGNGDVAVNAWIESSGELVFYLAKTDAWGDNGRLLKVGRLRIATDPALPVGTRFEQRLRLETGTLEVSCGEGADAVSLHLWVDAHHPVVVIEIEGARARTATATIDLWRTKRKRYPTAEVSDLLEDRSKPDRLHEPVFVEPDTILEDFAGGIGWYHWNEKSVGPSLTAELQGLSEFLARRPDPLLHRIFGAVVTATEGERLDATRLRAAAAKRHEFRVHVRAEHPARPSEWLARIRAGIAAVDALPRGARRDAHARWWREFWQRSWIHVTERAPGDPVPANAHPYCIGQDQVGANPFAGKLGRVSILPEAATATTVAQLAASRTDAEPPPARWRATEATPGPIADSKDWGSDGGLTLEAWIQPGELPPGGGRILDKITPGASDGILLDTYPGHSLRLIVGSRVLQVRDVLPGGQWVHVAATVDAGSGRLALYCNGVLVAEDESTRLPDADVVSRAYALQRWITACAGRGRFPIKFNGSLFTVAHEGTFGDADYRRWGPGYWWQNTRLPYLSLCTSGDFEMLRPLFDMYGNDQLPLHRFRTEKYFGHGGAFIPECVYFWGPTFTATYGWTPFAERADKLQESPWHKWEWVSGLELVWMMLDAHAHTEDETFLRNQLIPVAREILTFFVEHYETDDAGVLVMHPSQALETWWDCINPAPEVAGLRAVSARLLALPQSVTSAADRELWQRVLASAPELPTRELEGQRMLAPAERFANRRNVENPELYPVFPFRLVSFEKPNAPLGLRALEHRWDRGAFGWRQDDLFMTHLGLAEEARANLVARARNRHAGSRFPAFWGPNYDWVPDQDHGGVLMRTLQTMLLQTDGDTIHLLPAWPEGWDADWKLHAPGRTTITGSIREGRLEKLVVDPPARRADVVVHE